MYRHLQLTDPRDRWAIGLADAVLSPAFHLLRLLDGRKPEGRPRAILLLRLERIGDLLMTVGAIRAVRAHAEDARVDLVVGSWNQRIAELIGGIDHVELLDAPWLARGRGGAGIAAMIRQARSWRDRHYDVAINFEGDIRSNAILWLSGAATRVGFVQAGGGPFLTRRVTYDPRQHVAVNAMQLVDRAFEKLGDGDAPPSRERRDTSRAGDLQSLGAGIGDATHLVVPADARAGAIDLIASRVAGLGIRGARRSPVVGIHASGGREIKQWDPAKFAEVATRLARSHGATIVLTGSSADRPLVERIRRALPSEITPVDVTGDLDLVAMAALLGQLDLFVTGDTGPMHLAAAVGTPTVAVFGPSDPARWGPLSPAARIVRIDLACSPCNRIRRPPARCTGHEPDCLDRVDARRVYGAAVTLLARGGRLGAADAG